VPDVIILDIKLILYSQPLQTEENSGQKLIYNGVLECQHYGNTANAVGD